MSDPLEGLQLVDFDDATGLATITIAASVLNAVRQDETLVEKAKSIILHDDGKHVKSVEWISREDFIATSDKGAD